MKKLPALLLTATALSDFGSNCPSDKEAQDAIIKQMRAMGGQAAAKMFEDENHKLKLVGCVKGKTGSFKCEWSDSPMGPRQGRFAKGERGLTFIGPGA